MPRRLFRLARRSARPLRAISRRRSETTRSAEPPAYELPDWWHWPPPAAPAQPGYAAAVPPWAS